MSALRLLAAATCALLLFNATPASAQTGGQTTSGVRAIVGPGFSQSLATTVNGDLVSAGVGLRNTGSGSITLAGIPTGSTVQSARLYWGVTGAGHYSNISFAGNPIVGTLIGSGGDVCWGPTISRAYRADVTALVPGNGAYAVSGLPVTAADLPEGASLMVVYANPASPSRTIVIHDGIATTSSSGDVFSHAMTGFPTVVPAISARLTMLVGDGQAPLDGDVSFNGAVIGTNLFSGARGPFWDDVTVDITAINPTSPATVNYTTTGDCLMYVAAALSVQEASGDISASLTDSPDAVLAGANLTYTATLTNVGTGNATDATLLLPLPAGTSFVSVTPTPGATCNAASPVVCSWAGSTAPSASRSATIVAQVAPSVPQGTVLSATVTGSSAFPDPTPANNLANTTTTVNANADLSMTLGDSPDPVVAGAQLSYTATLSNAGPSDAQDASITLPLPAGTSFVSATPSTGGSCNAASPVVCTFTGATAPGATRTATVVALVATNVVAGTVLTATATAGTPTTDQNPGNNSASATTTVTANADLSITLGDSPDPVVAGAQLSYTATLSNAGPSDAQDASITLPLPAGTSFVSATPSTGGSCNAASPVVCTWAGATAPGATRSTSIVVLVAPSVVDGSVLSATATAGSPTNDQDPGNNTATTTTGVIARADLSITLSDSPDPVIAGAQLTYVATMSNAGPSDAQGANITLPLPAGTSFVSATVSAGGSCNAASPVVCTFAGATAPGTARTATIVALVAPSVLDGTVLSATATAVSPTTDPNPGDNTATSTTNVIARADLQIGLTSPVPQVLINVPVTFTATSLNAGPSDAQNVSLTLTLTPDFRYSSHVATGATCTTPQLGTVGAIVCTWAGATAPGVARTLTVVAFSNVEGNTAVNASTTSNTQDPNPDNNAAGLSVQVGYPFNEIPTLSHWGLLLLGLLMACMGFVAVRRQA